MLLDISQNSQKNNCARVSFLISCRLTLQNIRFSQFFSKRKQQSSNFKKNNFLVGGFSVNFRNFFIMVSEHKHRFWYPFWDFETNYSEWYCTQQEFSKIILSIAVTQPAFTCSKLTTETLEPGVKYVQS